MDTIKTEQTLQYINDKRTESKLPNVTELEIGEILKNQYLDEQYIAMKINEAKEAAELELKIYKQG